MIAAFLTHGESLLSAVRRTLNEATGAFSLVVLDSSQPEVLIAARKGNAGGLVVGLADDGTYVASDMSALLTYTRKFFFLEPGEVATLEPSSVTIYSEEDREVIRQPYQATHDLTEVAKGQYPHYMLKEIYEQSDVLVSSMQGRYDGLSNTVDLSSDFQDSPISKGRIQGITRCLLVGMGTSMHACMIGRHYLERFAGIPTEVDNAAEFRYRRPLLDANTLVISVTQSGETVDTLAAMDEAKRADCLQITICNTPGAQSTRLADLSLLLGAGAEISVASTKTLLASVMALHAVSLSLGKLRQTLTSEMEAEQVVNALQLPSAVSTVLGNSGKIFEVARKYAASEHFLFLGRGLGYPVALEGALKLKEVSYIHAEGYSAGEMKHGPIALVDDAMPTVAVCTRGDVHEKMLSNVEQIKARGGRVITLVSDGDNSFDKLSNDSIALPDVDPALGPIPSIVALQLLAYGIARERGLDIDQPRNLAKTVTVE
jgi:glucosamine--fructose-6-phosphate aminotransferase (isomerizing)